MSSSSSTTSSLFDPGGELAEKLVGERPDPADLQHRRIRRELPHILVGNSLRDDSQAAVPPLDPVGSGRIGRFRQRRGPLFDAHAHGPRIQRNRHEPLRVLLEAGSARDGTTLAERDRAAGMTDPGRGTEYHGSGMRLGDFQRKGQEVLGLLRIGGLEDGDLGEPCVVARVLLVLGGVHARDRRRRR